LKRETEERAKKEEQERTKRQETPVTETKTTSPSAPSESLKSSASSKLTAVPSVSTVHKSDTVTTLATTPSPLIASHKLMAFVFLFLAFMASQVVLGQPAI
jgi:hypothetical protein